MTERLTMAAYARHRGCTPRAVRKAIDAGRLAASVKLDGPGGRPTIDAELADREWEQKTDERKQRSAKKVGAGVRKAKARRSKKAKRAKAPAKKKAATRRKPKDDAEPVGADPAVEPTRQMTLNEANTAKANYAAETARLELLERKGQLLDAKAVRSEARDLGEKLKQRVENLPARLTAQVAAHCKGIDQHAVAVILEEGCREILEDLSADVTKLATG